ncbi:hypothetical protein F5J12DRAFT_787246 [Pisolithus orientalis]|uniref:uncharacterized protein n=1 Tax=Pisolithus orientalis TaxID=936130 RepID=UPI002224D706|nr:uncharacterized protein F5J12DRAFT_787246 [Pisolithus orientalis]KAI5986299.1 hypothetical protein F5J12DRAFT_787246 [Pisolithus orientalis]
MDVRTTNLSYLSMIIQYIGVQFRWFTYALQQANNPSNQLPDDWYWQVQVETHILKQALATCNSYGTIMKVPYVANELLWWMAIQNMGETALLAHIMELNVLQVKRGEEGKDSLPLLCDMDWMPSDSIGQLIESCDEMIHQEEEEICCRE